MQEMLSFKIFPSSEITEKSQTNKQKITEKTNLGFLYEFSDGTERPIRRGLLILTNNNYSPFEICHLLFLHWLQPPEIPCITNTDSEEYSIAMQYKLCLSFEGGVP